MRHTSQIRIDLNAIASNMREIYAQLGEKSQVCACALLQNLCVDVHFARLLRSYELTDELDQVRSTSARRIANLKDVDELRFVNSKFQIEFTWLKRKLSKHYS